MTKKRPRTLGPKGKQNAVKKRVEIETRRDTVMGLYLGGASSRQIAKQVGVTHVTVMKDINARLKAAAEACPATQELRESQRQKLTYLYLQWLPQARTSARAADICLKILRREAKLLGLDMPVEVKMQVDGRVEHEHQHTAQVSVKTDLSRLNLEELRTLRDLAEKAQAAPARPALPAPDGPVLEAEIVE